MLNFSALSYAGCCNKISAQSARYAGPGDGNMDFSQSSPGLNMRWRMRLHSQVAEAVAVAVAAMEAIAEAVASFCRKHRFA